MVRVLRESIWPLKDFFRFCLFSTIIKHILISNKHKDTRYKMLFLKKDIFIMDKF